jgi:putative tryptophan/tyrosine transport system substrate-binding protein
MKRGILTLVATVFLALATPSSADAQAGGRVWRIGFLSLVSADLEHYKPWFAAFRERLRELGYVEGENLVIEQRYADGQVARLPALAAELIRLHVDVLVAAPSGSAAAAKKATSTIPIVFMGEPDPVGTGLVAGLSRPGGNATGLADAHTDLVPKRLEQMVPSASRVGVLWNPSNTSTAPQVKTLQAAAPALSLSIVPVDVKGPGRDDLDRAFATIGKDRLGGLIVLGDPTLGNLRPRIAELATTHRLPASGTHRGWAEGGLLMSYGTDFVELFRQGAVMVDKIFKGANPATLPVERPTKFELVINGRTAKALGLTIPPSVLVRADAILE